MVGMVVAVVGLIIVSILHNGRITGGSSPVLWLRDHLREE